MNRIKVRQTGSFGHDINDDLTQPGLYTIPIPNYNDECDENGDYNPYEWIDVDIRKVLIPPETRLHVIIGYDENGESQMWYYNGSQNCFKRIWQGGVMGGGNWKNHATVVEYLLEDVEVQDENTAEQIADWFMSL